MKLIFYILIIFPFAFILTFAHDDCIEHFANDYRCGTFLMEKKKIKNYLQRRIYFDNNGRPKNQARFDSPSKLFTIHYDTIGVHQVPKLDKNGNGIPDYVDSVAYYADFVYNIQVKQIGLADPTNDSLGGGTPGYDIYLLDIGNGDEFPDSNGIQDPGGMYGFTVNDTEIFPKTTFPRYTSFIVIDNDFSATDSARPPGAKPYRVFKTTGIDAMKITLAHEFNHAIQFFIGFDDFGFSGIAEMLSVTFEEICFPEVNDYLQYARSLLKNPNQYSFAVSNPQNGYRYSLFFMMLVQKYGNNFIKNFFNTLQYGISSYRALDATLKKYNSSINDEWLDFIKWIYFTNYRTQKGSYFNDAELIPEISYTIIETFTPPSISYSDAAEPYQLRADRVIFTNVFPFSNDTLNIFITNMNPDAAFNQIKEIDNFSFSVTDNPQPDYTQIFLNATQSYYYKLSSSKGKTQCVLFEIPGVNTIPLSSTYPNPVFTKETKYIYFPVYDQAKIGENVELTIFNTNMIEIYRKNLPVSVIANNRVLIFDFEELDKTQPLGSGVYIFNSKSQYGSILGKFSIINN